ncbi:MAG TPA: cbb3-type cytochrome oxidase assembly protein CcoS [Bacteroidia bacterium]|nr:cbb3-type cytochrome oxidase assembly protein CcoS [Bacteroidia bacterium]
MSAIFILIGASLTIATGFLVAFIRSSKAGQFDDSVTPAVRILFENETVQKKENKTRK